MRRAWLRDFFFLSLKRQLLIVLVVGGRGVGSGGDVVAVAVLPRRFRLLRGHKTGYQTMEEAWTRKIRRNQNETKQY